MKEKMLAYLLLLSGIVAGNECWSQTWTPLPDLPTQNPGGGVSFTINDKVYLHTGKEFFEYNPAAKTWKQKNSFPDVVVNRSYAIAFSVNGKGYVGLGLDLGKGVDREKKDLWQYDPVADIWTRKADLPAVPRTGAGCFVIGNKAYIGGGTCPMPPIAAGHLNDFWEYDPFTDKWTQKADIPVDNLSYQASFSGNGKGYFTCGVTYANFSTATYEYNPVTDTWAVKADFPGTRRSSAVAFAIDGIAYCGTGAMTYALPNEMYLYDIATGTWQQEGWFPGPERWAATAAVVNGKAYFGTGATQVGTTLLPDWWEFTPRLAVQANPDSQIRLFPNPADDYVEITTGRTDLRLVIYDIVGRQVYNRRIDGNRSLVPIGHLYHGVYLYKIVDPVTNVIKAGKLLIQH